MAGTHWEPLEILDHISQCFHNFIKSENYPTDNGKVLREGYDIEAVSGMVVMCFSAALWPDG